MSLHLIAVLACVLPAIQLGSQNLLGYAHSTYAGIAGASYNPASIADNPFSVEILLVGAGVEGGNNYIGIRRVDLSRPDFGVKYFNLRTLSTNKTVFFRNEVLLPGIMFSNEKSGWGIDMKVRTYANVDGVEPPLAHFLAYSLNDPPNFEQSLYNSHVGITAMSWAEIGVTYAKTLRTGAEHYLSAGIRPKFLLGIGALYAFVNDAGYNFRNDSSLTLASGDLDFGHSDHFTFDAGYKMSYALGFNPGLGIDAGVIYEYRPDAIQAKDEKNKFKPWPGYRDRPLYKYRLGVAITDLGIIRFHHGEFSDHYSVDASLWDLDDEAFDTTAPAALYNTFELRKGGSKAGTGFWMRLPLALNTQFDYYAGHNFYINATAFAAIYLRNNDGRKVHELSRLSITPRWEKRWFAVWAPLSFSRLGITALGAGFRVGPLAIGTTDILAWAFPDKTVRSLDLYFVLKVPLFPLSSLKRNKDRPRIKGGIDECAD